MFDSNNSKGGVGEAGYVEVAESQVDTFEVERLRLSQAREQNPRARVVVTVSDLDDHAAREQDLGILSHVVKEKPVLASFNGVHCFNTVSAAHALSARLTHPDIYPPGSIFVITVDPHVGKNGEDGQNLTSDKRVMVEYGDGTILIGPSRAYMRAGEQWRGGLKSVREIDLDKLVELGFTERNGNDVFDGLRRFAPAAAALLSDTALEHLGSEVDPDIIPQLNIEEGTITDIERGSYGNIRVEVPTDRFAVGSDIAVKDSAGKLLFIAKRAEAFEGNQGGVVAANGSKYAIGSSPDNPTKSLYLAVVLGSLDQYLDEKLEVGEKLDLSLATGEDIAYFTAQKALATIGERFKGEVGRLNNGVKNGVTRALAGAIRILGR